MFDGLNLNQDAVRERQQALKGICPEARACWDQADLGCWFRSFALAARCAMGYKET